MKIIRIFFLIIVISIITINTVTNVSLANEKKDLDQYFEIGINTTDTDWNCETHLFDVSPISTWCFEHQHDYVYKIVYTYVCDHGIFTWCYPGYKEYYYDCQGSMTGWQDFTYMSGCGSSGE